MPPQGDPLGRLPSSQVRDARGMLRLLTGGCAGCSPEPSAPHRGGVHHCPPASCQPAPDGPGQGALPAALPALHSSSRTAGTTAACRRTQRTGAQHQAPHPPHCGWGVPTHTPDPSPGCGFTCVSHRRTCRALSRCRRARQSRWMGQGSSSRRRTTRALGCPPAPEIPELQGNRATGHAQRSAVLGAPGSDTGTQPSHPEQSLQRTGELLRKDICGFGGVKDLEHCCCSHPGRCKVSHRVHLTLSTRDLPLRSRGTGSQSDSWAQKLHHHQSYGGQRMVEPMCSLFSPRIS